MIGSVFICYVDGTDDAFRPPMVSTHVVFAGRRKTVMPIRNCGLLFRLGIQILWKGPMVFWPIALFLSIVWFKFQGWIKIIFFVIRRFVEFSSSRRGCRVPCDRRSLPHVGGWAGTGFRGAQYEVENLSAGGDGYVFVFAHHPLHKHHGVGR